MIESVVLRGLLALLTAWVLTLILGRPMIAWLQQLKVKQAIRDVGPQSHLKKAGTPTMGGVFLVISAAVSILLWAHWHNAYVWTALVVMVGCGLIGFVDDYRKVVQKHSRGLPAKWKYLWLSILALGASILLYWLLAESGDTQLMIPFGHWAINIGGFVILLAYFTIAGCSNAVNLTDGLDGLVSLPVFLVSIGLAVYAVVAGDGHLAALLSQPYVPGAGEMVVICGALAGSALGFLWFNGYPASVFMGDVGSLAYGGALAVVAIVIRQELILGLMGGIFVLEAISVILQVGSYRLRNGKRIFKMAPIHHHFELLGWPETRVIVRFWVITVALVIIGLVALLV